jgi:FAD/FMN-containing dehydrogenase
MKGPLYARGSSGYDRTRTVFNLRYAHVEPLAVAQPETPADVQACVEWARRHDVRLVPRAGGHSYVGYSTGQGALQVDVRRMDGWRVDRAARTAVVGPGARLMQVYAGLADHGVTIPAGSCPTVGLAGLALGGGHGLASRKLGLTCDSLREVRLVLADGRRVTASDAHHSDLFWACRGGGGGSFGIVTGFRFHVHQVHDATRFVVSWPWHKATSVMAAWQSWAPDAPDELDSILKLTSGASAPSVEVVGQYFGGTGRLRELLRPMTRVSGASVSMRSQRYLDVQLWLAGCSGESVGRCLRPAPLAFAAKSHYFRRPIPAAGRTAAVHAIEHAQRLAGDALLILDAYGGAINRVPAGATAFVHRDELFSGQLYASWSGDSAQHSMLKWLRQFHAGLKPYASGFAYQNYIDRELHDWQHAYYGSNWSRLVEVKARYDPDDVFRFRQSIPPH